MTRRPDVSRPVSRAKSARKGLDTRPAPITWQTARCEATALSGYMAERVAVVGTGCWEWVGSMYGNGYGRVRCQPNPGALAHRVAYELWVGPIPEGLTIDHLCRNKRCVNPAHLEAVTIKENVRRSVKAQAQMARTHCPRGHEYTPENTRVYKGMRSCRTCHRLMGAVYDAAKRDERNAACRARYYAKSGRTPPTEKKACGPRFDGSRRQAMSEKREAA